EYEGTRHNAGFWLADHLARRWSFGPFRRDGQSRQSSGRRQGEEVQLLKPQTYMNRSGAALAPLRSLLTFDPARDLLVLVDDVAIPVGTFRLRGAGSAGGHNGLKSIEGSLRRQDYPRLRIGVGPVPAGFFDLADFVLAEPPRGDRAAIEELLEPMSQAVEVWLSDGIEVAMNRFNRS
ncbi:MAG: aminoacyl-tRNA hydrolase, partial [Gemmatimonadales bacterium]